MSSKKVFDSPDQDLEVRLAAAGTGWGQAGTYSLDRERGLPEAAGQLGEEVPSRAPPTATRWEGGSHVARRACSFTRTRESGFSRDIT